jgi:tetrahydromethanopterin S-methyltransferase subunit A
MSAKQQPPLIGDVVFGSADSPVAVCTLASRSLLPRLEGRPEIAIAGRVYTENVGLEKMVQNLLADARLRFLIICGRESRHRVGQAILSLHRNGVDPVTKMIRGATATEPVLPNLTVEDVEAFQRRFQVIDLIGEQDAERVLERAREVAAGGGRRPAAGMDEAMAAGGRRSAVGPSDATAPAAGRRPPPAVIRAEPDPPSDWKYDRLGFFLIQVDRQRGLLLLEHYTQDRQLHQRLEGETAVALSETALRLGLVSEPTHAAYLGRELAKAEAALRLGLHYEQDSPLKVVQSPRSKSLPLSTLRTPSPAVAGHSESLPKGPKSR